VTNLARVDILTPIHKAMRSMIYELGKELQTTDFTDEHANQATVSHLNPDISSASSASILSYLKEHHELEEKDIFPQVRAYEPKMIDTLLQEHGEIVKMMTALLKIVDELKATRNQEQKMEVGDKLNRSANDLFAFYLTHISGEDVTIVPAMWKHLTDEQLIAVRANIEKDILPERYAGWMSWIFPSLNVNELTGMFIGLKKGAPAPVFENMARMAEKALSEDRWRTVKAKAGI
jgi:hemerythrin-like domain-containing protein